ncbi:MAG: hypothetical protein IKQ28_05400 [Lachnospiraceae bacterium]|nr:hypothetical protein [Lachnospiraceae bacterium]
MLVINAILHLLIDGICAFSMFGKYAERGAEAYLFYNLFAFALQMPFGALCDAVCSKLSGRLVIKRFYWGVTLLGVLFTILGMAFGFPALGVGNALFHIGGGLTSIKEDDERKLKGAGLGAFVAPGAIGIFLGKELSAFSSLGVYIRNAFIFLTLALVLAGFLRLYYEEKHFIFLEKPSSKEDRFKDSLKDLILSAFICFVVVVLRSFIGQSVGFSWKSSLALAFTATLAVAFGKAAGGFLAAKIGELKAVVISLTAASVFYIFSEIPVCGILSLFFFNMTMPVTLYILIKKMPRLPGFSFGLLTFGLFVGFYIFYLEPKVPVSGGVLGCAGSVISLILLSILTVRDTLKDKREKKGA